MCPRDRQKGRSCHEGRCLNERHHAHARSAGNPAAKTRSSAPACPRIDGVEKASGAAKYAADINTPGTLYVRLLTSDRPHAKIKKLNVKQAEKVPGVKMVHIIKDVDAEVHWDGDMIAAVAAERIEQAMEGVKAIEIEYEALPVYVDDRDVEAAEKAGRTKSLGNRETKEFDAALKAAAHTHKGFYGIPVISHMCMEPHGSHCEWKDKENLLAHVSTQWTSGIPGQLAQVVGVDAANVTVICNYIGGGFGSKFAAGEWGQVCAVMAQKAGRPIRLVLDRATELKTPGTRPSAFAEITVGADADGNVTCWDSHQWGTNGPHGGNDQLPACCRMSSPRSRTTVARQPASSPTPGRIRRGVLPIIRRPPRSRTRPWTIWRPRWGSTASSSSRRT